MSDLRHGETWRGTHMDVAFEISHHGVSDYQPQGVWCYYLIVSESQLSLKDFGKLWLEPTAHYDRSNGSKTPMYPAGSWFGAQSLLDEVGFHGGITFYEKNQPVDGEQRWVKVGCDYNHLWDQEKLGAYNAEWLEMDARKSIARLTDLLRFKLKCSYTGRYIFEKSGVWHDDRFYTKPGLVEWQKWQDEIAARKATA